jgi:ceramide glucosyltransferase
MTLSAGVLITWVLFGFVPLITVSVVGWMNIRRARAAVAQRKAVPTPVPLEIVVPVKGSFPGQETVLKSLLEQDYPSYRVLVVLESDDDPAHLVVDRLCSRYPHAIKVISGISTSCGQKNHNLIEGMKHLNRETQVIVICDSANVADPAWLTRFTEPLRSRTAEVVTTFRAFRPEPNDIWGVCQAIYGALVLILTSAAPKPWGGATAILRKTFEQQKVIEAWSRTVVDDLVLGNVLEAAGIKVFVDPVHLLTTPVKNQTLRGLLSYLDRQILFPKFTNPGVWLGSLFVHLNMTLAFLVAAVLAVLFLLGHIGSIVGWGSIAFVLGDQLWMAWLHKVSNARISLGRWLILAVPLVFLAAYIFARSVFINYLDWHGRRYWCGKGGLVKRIDYLPTG